MKITPVPLSSVVKSMGLVFGDIGTSPIYAMTTIFLLIKPTTENVMGIISLIIWTLTIFVTVQYTYLAMGLGRKGEGGTIVLREILMPMMKSAKQKAFVSLISIIGIALFIGDGVITPAISILSAVEGILLIPGFEETVQYSPDFIRCEETTAASPMKLIFCEHTAAQLSLIILACLIVVMLFLFQRRGSDRVASAFGPIMVVWFSVLAVTGVMAIATAPGVLLAVNPMYAIGYLASHQVEGFLLLSSIILVATGGEALYADMGHLGKEPIRRAWCFVFVALVLCYMGQGAFILSNPDANNILFEMIFSQMHLLYVPFLLLSIAATIIASQAMISGIFSIVYQGITTNILPLMKIDYTSPLFRSQIYIDLVNWFMMLAVLFVILIFQTSNNLSHAYGLAICGTMTVTGIMILMIFAIRRRFIKSMIAMGVFVVDAVFLLSCFGKIPSGGYWSLVIAAIPLALILIYIHGQERLMAVIRPVPFDDFIMDFRNNYPAVSHIAGTALFFAQDCTKLPQYIPRTMFANGIIYEDNVIISVIRTDEPFGVEWRLQREIAPGLSILEIDLGYMEVVDIEDILEEAGIDEKTIMYGMEDIITTHRIWRVFAIIKRNSPSFVQFYKLPPDEMHGVVTRIEM